MLNLFVFKVVNHLSFRCLKIDFIRIFLIHFLKGHSKEELESAAEQFYTDFLVEREIHQVTRLLDKYKGEVILVSATIDPVMSVVAKHLQVYNYYSSKLQYTDRGLCRGRLAKDLVGLKKEILCDSGFNPPFELTISNDFTDLPLFKNSNRSIIITLPKNKSFWMRKIKKENLINVQLICLG